MSQLFMVRIGMERGYCKNLNKVWSKQPWVKMPIKKSHNSVDRSENYKIKRFFHQFEGCIKISWDLVKDILIHRTKYEKRPFWSRPKFNYSGTASGEIFKNKLWTIWPKQTGIIVKHVQKMPVCTNRVPQNCTGRRKSPKSNGTTVLSYINQNPE